MRLIVLALASVLIAAGGVACAGDDGPASGDRTSATTSAGALLADAELSTDIAQGLGEIGAVSAGVSSCADSGLRCTLRVVEEVGDLAQRRLVGLRARVQDANDPCTQLSGEYYVLALDRHVRARDLIRRGKVEAAVAQIKRATHNVTQSGEVAGDC